MGQVAKWSQANDITVYLEIRMLNIRETQDADVNNGLLVVPVTVEKRDKRVDGGS